MNVVPETGKERLWLACKQKKCCHSTFIIPTGHDVWQIARSLAAPPWSYLLYFQTTEPRRDAFALDGSGRLFRIALAKGTPVRKGSPAPCIFLMRTRHGHHRCGLGSLRPLVCRTFPSEIADGLLYVRGDHGCTCRAWGLGDVDTEEEKILVEARQDESERYCGIVAQWNKLVVTAADGVARSFQEYCEFVLRAYDEAPTGAVTRAAQ